MGATTRAGLITAPLRSRFGIIHRLDFYSQREMEIIIARSAELLGVGIDREGISEIARCSRGTPRIANRLLRRVRDYAQIFSDGRVSESIARHALDKMEVDTYGLDEIDRRLLLCIIEKFNGGPVGIGPISASIGEDKEAIEELYEPYLIQIGFLNRTRRGRVVTPAALAHFGLEPIRRDNVA